MRFPESTVFHFTVRCRYACMLQDQHMCAQLVGCTLCMLQYMHICNGAPLCMLLSVCSGTLLVARDVVLCVCGIFASCTYSALIGGCFLAPRAVWSACVGFGLPMHAQLLRLFVTLLVGVESLHILPGVLSRGHVLLSTVYSDASYCHP